jgi:hypothetical protein
MEKNTKILLGVGAVIAAYLILKPKKAVTSTTISKDNIVSNNVLNQEALYTTSINVSDLVCDKNRVGDVSKNCINEETKLEYLYMPALKLLNIKQAAFYTLEKDDRVYTYDINGKFLNADRKRRGCEYYPEGC